MRLNLDKYPDRACAGGGFGPVSHIIYYMAMILEFKEEVLEIFIIYHTAGTFNKYFVYTAVPALIQCLKQGTGSGGSFDK